MPWYVNPDVTCQVNNVCWIVKKKHPVHRQAYGRCVYDLIKRTLLQAIYRAIYSSFTDRLSSIQHVATFLDGSCQVVRGGGHLTFFSENLSIYTTIGGLSSKFDEFLAVPSQLDSDHGVDKTTLLITLIPFDFTPF